MINSILILGIAIIYHVKHDTESEVSHDHHVSGAIGSINDAYGESPPGERTSVYFSSNKPEHVAQSFPANKASEKEIAQYYQDVDVSIGELPFF